MLPIENPTALINVAQFFLMVAAFVFILSALDDFLIDLTYYVRFVYRKLFKQRKYRPLLVEDLVRKKEKHIALMLPAWQASDVLYGAVTNLINTINYKKYHIFIGTYPNDKNTQREADVLAKEYPHVHKVVVSAPGPTNKADCLNHIVEDIFRLERLENIRFEAVIMHNVEDEVHSYSFKLFNTLLPRFDLVQIPVFSQKRKWHEITGGHYMDEFAEFHSKEILVREQFGNVVPGAGVGCAYSRRALRFAKSKGEYFNTQSLTEEYDFSYRMRGAGLKQIFARVPLRKRIYEKDRNGIEVPKEVVEYISIKEGFPNKFEASVRQKTRWTIGMSFQGWASFGWRGSLRTKYFFWRDRKKIIFSHVIALGVMSFIILLLNQMYRAISSDTYPFMPILEGDSKIGYLVYFSLGILVYRIIQRHIWTGIYYGWSALTMIIPRYIWGAIINYLAVINATAIYFKHLINKNPIAWDDEAQTSLEEMEEEYLKYRLGEILIERGIITKGQLDQALVVQQEKNIELGQVFVNEGILTHEELIKILGKQSESMADKEEETKKTAYDTSNEAVTPEKNNIITIKVGDNMKSTAEKIIRENQDNTQIEPVILNDNFELKIVGLDNDEKMPSVDDLEPINIAPVQKEEKPKSNTPQISKSADSAEVSVGKKMPDSALVRYLLESRQLSAKQALKAIKGAKALNATVEDYLVETGVVSQLICDFIELSQQDNRRYSSK